MKRLAVTLAVLMVFVLGAGSVTQAAQPMSPAKACKGGVADSIAEALEGALFDAHGIVADLDVSQGACVSTVATHASAGGVNTTALATDFCKQAVGPGSDVSGCVEHVKPALFDIFHGD